MKYYVARDGQTYGPYSLETVQKYLAEGSILATDSARTDEMSNWVPLSQLISAAVPVSPIANQQPTVIPTVIYDAGSRPIPNPPVSPAGSSNRPPPLHWALVLLFSMITSGIFGVVWTFVQAGWIKSIDPSSTAVRDYFLGMILGVLGCIGFAVTVVAALGTGDISPDRVSIATLGSLSMSFVILMAFAVAGVIFHVKGVFGIRASMVRYYHSVEPINLRLSVIMTLFFNIFYFQHHFTRIATWKRTGFLEPQK